MLDKNNRKTSRFQVQIEASYSYNNNWNKCLLLDLNNTGAAIKIPQYLIPDDMIILKITVENESILVKARVCHNTGQKIGVEFIEISDQAKSLIEKITSNSFNDRRKNFNKYFFR